MANFNNNSNSNNNNDEDSNSNQYLSISDAFKSHYSRNNNCFQSFNTPDYHIDSKFNCDSYTPIVIQPALPPSNLPYTYLNYHPKFKENM